MIKVEVHSTRAVIREQVPLTVGLRGATARFVFGADWADLIKTAVFRQGEKTVTVSDISEEVTIPWEVLTLPGVPVQIGVYGSNSDETVAIPTLWTQTDPVRPGADPEGDPSAEPTPGLWEQMQGKLGSLEQLKTDAKSSLVDAVNEANRPVCVIVVTDNEDGTHAADQGTDDIAAMQEAGVPFVCYWYDKNVVLNLANFQSGGAYVFTAVDGGVEYNVLFNKKGIDCTMTQLAKKEEIPTKVSSLENDRGFLTEAPVSSVNGQTGDVTVLTPLKVIIEQLSDGSYQPDPPLDELEEFHDQGYLLYCQYGNLELPLTSAVPHFYTFSCVEGGNVHTVRIGPSSVKVSTVPVGGGTDPTTAVLYTPQNLTPDQKTQARENIGACDNIRPKVALSDSVVTLEPNQFYVFPEMASLSITFGGEADSGAVQEYQFRFISGAVATTLILPEAVKGDITVDANSVVEVSVVGNYAISQSWAVG